MSRAGIFAAAAFRATDGRVCSTGPLHDPDLIPDGFQIQDEGFVDHDGTFYTRDEAMRFCGMPAHRCEIHATDTWFNGRPVVANAKETLRERWVRKRYSKRRT